MLLDYPLAARACCNKNGTDQTNPVELDWNWIAICCTFHQSITVMAFQVRFDGYTPTTFFTWQVTLTISTENPSNFDGCVFQVPECRTWLYALLGSRNFMSCSLCSLVNLGIWNGNFRLQFINSRRSRCVAMPKSWASQIIMYLGTYFGLVFLMGFMGVLGERFRFSR